MIAINILKNKRLYNPYVLLGILSLLIAVTIDQTKELPVAALMAAGMAVLFCIAIFLLATGKFTSKNILILLIAAGVVLRVGYVLYTPYTVRQHDVGVFGDLNGHTAYIKYIAENLALPDNNERWQFYHPPLHHILAAIWLNLNLALGATVKAACENIQILPCFYSCAAMIVCLKIFRELSLPDRAVILGMAVICFHPTFILLAGSINNDMLMILFCFAVILYAIRWYRRPTMKSMVLDGLFLGLGMMSKLSAVLLAPMLAFLFLAKIWQQRQDKNLIMQQIKQGAVFACVSIPLGIWYPIRNLLLFGQSLTYVPGLSPSDGQYIGNYSLADRLWKIPWKQLLFPCQDWTYGYNIPLSLLKTATFGESNFHLQPFDNILLYINILLVILSVYAMIRMLFTKTREENTDIYRALGIIWLVLMLSYIKFCLAYPSICTQDFRYIVPTILTGSVFLGAFTTRIKKGSILQKVFVIATEETVVLFCVFVSLVYIALGI